jgi:DinB superfamily
MKRPKKSEYAPFHETYISKLPPRGTAKSLLKSSLKETNALFAKVPESKGDHAYEKGKWTIKQVLIHSIDTERVFAYRTLSFLRGDNAALPGFNQEVWMEAVNVEHRSIKDLLKEWKSVRENTLFLLAQCSDKQSMQTGVASGFRVSVRAYFYIIIGHHLHHLEVLKARYL